jgi:hypothetical protein
MGLEMKWDKSSDVLLYPVRNIPNTQLVTTKEILQQTSRIYDPIRSKIILQEIWQQKFELDMPLPDNIREK